MSCRTGGCIECRVCAVPVTPVLDLLQRDPGLVVHVLHRLLGWELERPTRALPADVADTQVHARGREWAADLAFELRRLDGTSSWLAVVAPAARDAYEHEFLWPCYAALLGSRRGGPAGLLAIVPAVDDLAWARRTIACDFGALVFTPVAVTIDQLYALRERLMLEGRP
jgi:hypothetical protein